MLHELNGTEREKEPAREGTVQERAVSGKQIESFNITGRKIRDGVRKPETKETRLGSTGRLRTGNTGQLRTGNTGQLRTGNTGQLRLGNTGQLRTGNTGRIRQGNTGQIRMMEVQRPEGNKAERPARRRTIDRRVHGTGETDRLWPEETLQYLNEENVQHGSGRIRNRRSMKRRRQVQRNNYMMLASFGMICLVIVVGLHFLGESKKAKAASSQEAQQVVQEQETGEIEIADPVTETLEEQVARVKQEAKEKGFPDSIIELLDKNPETLQFVEDYEFKDTFQTSQSVGDSLVKGEIPQLLQWDERWGYAPYGTGCVATCGCGPTCLSMVISGMTGDASVTPAVVAQYSDEKGYIDENNNTYWELMTAAPKHWGLSVKGGKTSEEEVAAELADGNVIVCSVGPGDFTKSGHFIVLTGYNDGNVKVNDPFNQENSEKVWKYKDIKGQIKSLWVYSD